MGTIKKLKNKLSTKGSVLVFTLIVLFIILAAAIGISSVSVLERKGAHSTDVSVQSFQIANSGAEIILKKLSNASGSDSLTSVGCSGGRVIGSISVSGGKNYEITFYRNDETQITDCATDVSEVGKIKSIGSYANTTRAIEVAVAQAGSGPGSWTCQAISGVATAKCTPPEKIIIAVCQYAGGSPNPALPGIPWDYGGGVFGVECPTAGQTGKWGLCCQ